MILYHFDARKHHKCSKRRNFSVFSYRVRADGGTCLLRETINVVIRPVKQARIKASISGFQNKKFASQTRRKGDFKSVSRGIPA